MSEGAQDRTDEWPRIGEVAVAPEALAAPGMPLADLAAELGAQVDMDAANAPSEGWRVLRRMNNESLILGAPAPEDRWHVAWMELAQADRTFRPLPNTQPLRPSIAERRAGLELRWPRALPADADVDALAIDVLNAGDERWMPDGEAFQAIGVLTGVGETTFAFGTVPGAFPAVPLDPGEYARLAVHVNPSSWNGLAPGPHDLHVVLIGVGLHAEPRRVEVTADHVARHERGRRAVSPARRRRMLTAEADRMRLALDAGRSLVKIAEYAASASTESEVVARLQAVLDCDAEAARSVLHSPLSDLLPANAPRQQERIVDVAARIEAL